MGTKQQLEDSLLAERLRKPRFDSPYGLTQLQEYRASLHQWFKEYSKLLDEVKADFTQALSEVPLDLFEAMSEAINELRENVNVELAQEERLLSNDDDYEAEELE